MDKYRVEILNRAYKNIDDIYEYIANELLAPEAAIHLVKKFEDALLSLETMPIFRKGGSSSAFGHQMLLISYHKISYMKI